MPLVTAGGQSLFFAHVPKTGGSSVEEYLVRRFGGRPSLIDAPRRPKPPWRGLIMPATHLSAEDLRELLPPRLDFCFAVVRDPLERLVSEYRWQSGASRTSRLDVSTWIRLMLECVRIDRRAYENHIRPQSELVPEGAEVFRLEEGLEALTARLDDVVGATAPGLSIGHFKKRERTSVRLHRQEVALVAAFYRVDYERFGYAPPDLSALPNDRLAPARQALARALAPAIMRRQRRRWLR